MKDEYFVVKRGSTVIPNATVADSSISVTALGLLTWMLFMPPGASLGYRAFLGRGLGEKAVRNSMRELESAGYRWRFQTRTVEGTLRTATLVFEQPVIADEAWSTVTELSNNRVEQCLTSNGDAEHNPLSDRADTGAARSDKGKRGAAGSAGIGETASGTVPRSTVARSTAARSTVPRSAEAQPSKDGFKEPKGSPPDQTSSARDDETGVGRGGLAGSGLDGVLKQCASEVMAEDWELMVDCLPPEMRRIEPSAVPKVAAALRERVEAGWRPDALRATLAGNSLPPQTEIRTLAGLVGYRVGQIPVQPPQRRTRPAAAAPPVEHRERPVAFQRRDEARVKGDPDAEKSAMWWLAKYPPSNTGEAGPERGVAS